MAPGLGVAVAVLAVSFAAPLFRLADAGPITASFWRLALAVLLLLPFTWGSWPRWRRYSGRDWAIVAGTGTALAAHFALWVQSLHMTGVADATVLVTLQAIFVALGGHFLLGDRMSGRAWAGVVVAVAGATVVAFGGILVGVGAESGGVRFDARALAGDALAVVAGLGSALYMLVGRRLRRDRGLIEYVVPVYAAAALALVAGSSLLGLVSVPEFAAASENVFAVGGANFYVFVLLAAVPMLGGHTVSNWTLKYLPAHVVATWILLEPVGAALLAWPLLNEVPSWAAVAGGALILAGAAMTLRPGAKTAEVIG